MSRGLPYDSDAGRAFAGAVTALMTRLRLRHLRSSRRPHGAIRGVREEPRVDARRHREAPAGAGAHRRVAGAGALAGSGDVRLGRGAVARPRARLSQRPGQRPGADGHHRLHDGLRHDGRGAGHRPRQLQATGRRRHDQDGEPHGAARSADPRLRAETRSRRSSPTSTRTASSKGRRTCKEEHLPVFDCALRPSKGTRCIAPAGPRAHDGRHPAVHLRRHLQDCEPAQRVDGRRGDGDVRRGLARRPQGDRHLPRRLQADAAGEHGQGGRRARRQAGATPSARTRGTPSPTSSPSRGTRATSPSARTRTGRRARSSSRWRRKGARSPA